MNEENAVRALVDEIVASFMKFEQDAMKRMTGRGIPVEVVTEVLSRSMYECLFETVHLAMKLSHSAVTGPMVGHRKAFSDWVIHEEVARRISTIMLRELERTGSRYRWRIVVMKHEKQLK